MFKPLGRRLSITFDFHIEKSLRNKRIANELEEHVPKLRSANHMFEHFFLIGAPPDFEGKPEPTILATYPAVSVNSRIEDELKLIKSFCFPVSFRPIPSDINKVRVILNEFIFYLNEGSNRIFGTAIHFQANEKCSFASEKSRKYPFCFCFLTLVPFLSSHFQFLSYLALVINDRVHPIEHGDHQLHAHPKLKPTPSGSNFPTISTSTNEHGSYVLSGLEVDSEFPNILIYHGIKATKLLNDELVFYHSLPISNKSLQSQRGEITPFPPIPLSKKMSLYLPLHLRRQQCLAYSTFHALFSNVMLSDIIKIYTATLLEMHVLFVSEYTHRLTSSIIASLSLLDPFKTIATMKLPILPTLPELSDFFDSPTPYVIGSCVVNNKADLVVNLDTGSLTINTKIPDLPDQWKLLHKLQLIMNDYQKEYKVPPREIHEEESLKVIKNKDYLDFIVNTSPYNFPYVFTSLTEVKFILPPHVVDMILDSFRSHLPSYINDLICGCFVTDTTDVFNPVTIFNKDLFLMSIPRDSKAFYELFVQTEIWEDYCNTLADEFAAIKKSQSMEFNAFNNDEDTISEAMSCPSGF